MSIRKYVLTLEFIWLFISMELLNVVLKFVLFVLIAQTDAQGKGRGISKRTWASAK